MLLIVVVVFTIVFARWLALRRNYIFALRRRRRQDCISWIQMLLLRTEERVSPLVRYMGLNRAMPVLRIYFDVERDTRPDYRLNRQSINGLIQILIEITQQDHGWGQQLEVLVFVFWLAHALSYRVTSRTFSIPKSTVCRVVHKMARQIKNVVASGRVISYPRPGQLYGVGHGFAQLARHPAFIKAVGAIDGCHIRIKPPGRNKEDYFNYKQFYSIQMQAVCDSTGRFLNIFVGYPGSVHDTQVFKNSPLYYNAEYPPPGYFLLSDGGYPCIDTPIRIVTPFKMPLQGPVQERFNRCHLRGRTIIEQAFGMMKARWRRTLFSALEVKVGFCTEVVIACAFLHNVCLTHGDVLEPEDAEDADAPSPDSSDASSVVDRSGVQFRDRLAARVSAPVDVQPPLIEHDYTL